MNTGGRSGTIKPIGTSVGIAIAVVLTLLVALIPIVGSDPAAAQADRLPPSASPDDVDQGSEPGDRRERASQHIINGTPIAITERPWHVLVSDETFGGSWCGGSILAENLVLTAAHCVDNEFLSLSNLLVVAGTNRWRDVTDGQWSHAANVTIHPSYDPDGGFDGTQGSDLALIELSRPLTFNDTVQPIALADPAEAAAALGQDGDLAGWGVSTIPADEGRAVEELLNAGGEVISDTFCGALIGRVLNGPLEICLDGITTNQTGCFGDSGGGLTVEIGGVRKLLGVASFTLLDCSFDMLVFAETTNVRSWIAEHSPPVPSGAAIVSGRVWDDLNFDSIEEPSEVGLAGIEVTMTIPPPYPLTTSPISLTAFTDADGRYSFVAPFGGWYEVSVGLDPSLVASRRNGAGTEATNTDAASWYRDPAFIEPTILSTSRFLVTPGQTLGDTDFGATRGAVLSGVVFDDLDRNGQRDAGEPLTGSVDAWLDLYWVDPIGGEGSAIEYHGLLRANEFMFMVPPGTAYLSFYNFTERRVTLPNRGEDSTDNDFSPFTNLSETFDAVPGESYVFDLGLTPPGSGDVFSDVANTDCDAQVSIIDALVIAQYTAGIRTDGATCPLPDPATQLNVANADVNLDGLTDIIDALLISQCDAGLATPFCAALN